MCGRVGALHDHLKSLNRVWYVRDQIRNPAASEVHLVFRLTPVLRLEAVNLPSNSSPPMYAVHRELRFDVLGPSLLPFLAQARSHLHARGEYNKIEYAMPEQSYGESFEPNLRESRLSAIRTKATPRLLVGGVAPSISAMRPSAYF
jgi:hypothetical protein